MRKLALSLLLASALFAQNPNTAAFPGRVATDADLFVATNLGSTTLAAQATAGATSLLLASATGFTAPVVVVVDAEIFHCTTLSVLTLSGCSPGAEGTVQATHALGASVKNIMTAWHHNQMAAEVKALEASSASAVTGVTNDTNIQGTVTGHTLAFSWAGALAAARMANAGVHTGDAVGTFPAVTLNTVNINVGTFGDATHVGQFTVDGKGRITAASSVAVTGGGSSNTLTAVSTSTTPTFTRSSANQEWSFTISTSNSAGSTSGLTAGDILVFNLTQCATAGGCTFTWPTGFTAEGCTIAAGNLSTGVASLGIKQTFYWDGSSAHAMTPCVTTASTSDLMLTDSTNTAAAAFTLDASAATTTNAVKTQVKAGATATANGAIAYDSTNNMLHAAQSTADAFVPQFTAVPANNDCAKWVVSGSNYKLGTQGSACGSGGTTNTTPNISLGGYGATYTSLSTSTTNTLYLWLLNISGPTTIAKILFGTQSSTNQAWAVYSVAGSSSALLATGGSGSGCGGCGYVTTLAYTFTTPGAYYIAFCASGATDLFVSGTTNGAPGVGSITTPITATAANPCAWSGSTPNFPSTTGALTANGSVGYPNAILTY